MFLDISGMILFPFIISIEDMFPSSLVVFALHVLPNVPSFKTSVQNDVKFKTKESVQSPDERAGRGHKRPRTKKNGSGILIPEVGEK